MDKSEDERLARDDYRLAGLRLKNWRHSRYLTRNKLANEIQVREDDIINFEQQQNSYISPLLLVNLTRYGAPTHQFFSYPPDISPLLPATDIPVLSSMAFISIDLMKAYSPEMIPTRYYSLHAPSPDLVWRVFEWPLHPFDPSLPGVYHLICHRQSAENYKNLEGNAVLVVLKGQILTGWCTECGNEQLSFSDLPLLMHGFDKSIPFSELIELWVIGKITPGIDTV